LKRTPAFLLLLASQLFVCTHAAPPPATAQAAKAGIKTCLPAIEKVETYLVGKQAAEAVIFWDNAAADSNLFSALIELEDPNANSIANLNVVPSADGQCIAEYSQTGYAAQNCMDYLKTMGNSVRHVRDLGRKSSLFQGQGVQILLTNAGNGCLWVRKEIIRLPAANSAKPSPAAAPGTKPAQPKRGK
jgi:hypothetical protein